MRQASPSHRQSMTNVKATGDFRSIIRERLDNSLLTSLIWRPRRDLNPRLRRERALIGCITL